jgi:predicted ribosome quality control (RQC) complex YloA/Tae2 family protein
MDYLTLRRHCKELEPKFADKPLITRAVEICGRGIALKLKRQNRLKTNESLIFQLEPSCQSLRLGKAEEKPEQSTFTRQLNRLLTNGRIISCALHADENKNLFDRVVRTHIVVADRFFGGFSEFYLLTELTGRIANIFLCDFEFRIIESFARTENNQIKEIYRLPSSNCILNPIFASEKDFLEAFSLPFSTWPEKIGGFSPQFSRELAFRSANQKTVESLAGQAYAIMREYESSKHCYLAEKNEKLKAFCCFFPSHCKDCKIHKFQSVNRACEFIESNLGGKKRFSQSQTVITRQFKKELKHKMNLLEKQTRLKEKYQNSEHLQKTGQLIVANLYKIKPGSDSIIVDDWETGKKTEIKLNPSKQPSAQAEKYFHKYRKACRGIAKVEKRIKSLKTELKWLKEQIWLAENAENESDLPPPLKKFRTSQESTNKTRKKVYFKPFLEIENCRYYVGKNGKQNETLTFSVAGKKDWWFHANDVPGAHVILKKAEGEPTDQEMENAALLAAWFSFARQSGKAAVDYTLVSKV